MHNIVEGSDASTDAEFIRFLRMARRSCSEVQSQLYLALDRRHISADQLKQAYDLADEVKRLTNVLISNLRRSAQSSRRVSELPETYLTTPAQAVET
jgi:four helix bundle protein